MSWCTIESDPAVFTQLIASLGVPSVQVEEVYSLEDKGHIERLEPIYGLIFLFKWMKDPQPRQCLLEYDRNLFFARQVINNACATQAILAVLLNAPIQLSGVLKDFHEFTKELPSQDKGLAIGNSDIIRELHNSFRQPEPVIFKQDKKSKKEQEAFHFVSYVPFKGMLYELDGLQKGPICLGAIEGGNWLSIAEHEIQKRIKLYEQKEIRFTLLAVCEKPRNKAIKRISELEKTKLETLRALQKIDNTMPELVEIEQLKARHPSTMETEPPSQPKESLCKKLKETQNELATQQCVIVEQTEKADRQKKENVRRRHNYIPLIIEMLKVAATKGKLSQLLQNKKKKNN